MVLKKYILTNMLTYRVFSSRVGIDQSQLIRYANGSKLPNLKNALKIYKATNKKVGLEDWFKPIPQKAK